MLRTKDSKIAGRGIIDQNGLPESFYMDQAGIYGKVDIEWESQISRAFEQVGIRLILAGSSQANSSFDFMGRKINCKISMKKRLRDDGNKSKLRKAS